MKFGFSMPDALVRDLFDGPLDIVGDVHGELDALRNLLHQLGHSDDGLHPEKRRLVFVGDLADRGPDSPGVVSFVQGLVESGAAQCVLGNHDLNILLKDRKHDNHWFFGEEFSLDGSDEPTPAVIADEMIRDQVIQFFQTLPLALERDDLRVIHACWDDEMIEVARRSSDAVALHQEHAERITAAHNQQPDLDKVEKGLEFQNRNPVKVLTSGKEQRAAKPFEASGKLRYQERVSWWHEYDAEPFCVFGHYSMYRGSDRGASQAICADYAVAKRWQERKQHSFDGDFQGMLAAIRFPEKVVVFDNGDIEMVPGER
jgi:hypothetical protein